MQQDVVARRVIVEPMLNAGPLTNGATEYLAPTMFD